MQSTTCQHCAETGIYYVPPSASVPGYWLCHQHWQSASINNSASAQDTSGYGLAPPVRPPAIPVRPSAPPQRTPGYGVSSAPRGPAPRNSSSRSSSNKGAQIAAGVIGAILAQVAVAIFITQPWNDRARRPAPYSQPFPPITQPYSADNDWMPNGMHQQMQEQLDELQQHSRQQMQESHRRMQEQMEESQRRMNARTRENQRRMEELRNRHRRW